MDNMEAIEKLELLSNYLNPKWTETDSCKEALKMGTHTDESAWQSDITPSVQQNRQRTSPVQ